MVKRACLLLVTGLSWAAAAGAQQPPQAPPSAMAEALRSAASADATRACDRSNPAEVVVCGRSTPRYRIDPGVLAAERAVETPPAKAPLDASTDQSCTGPNCGGGTIPLVGMALTAIKAAELAAQGDDWREAFRMRPDAYGAYEDAKAKQSKKPHVTIGVSAGSNRPPG